MAKKNQIKEENLDVQEAISASGQWIIRNQNLLMWIVCGILAVVVLAMALNQWVFKPRQAAASDEVAKAAVYFGQNEYQLALEGDEADCIGFEAIAKKYGMTKPGKLAALYAGICYYNMEDYEQAIRYMKKFDGKDINVAPAAKQHIGDAYVALGDYASAALYFEKAAKSGNEIIAPMSLKKAGLAYMELGKNKKALACFQTIKNTYPHSAEAEDADKLISLVK